MDLCGWCLLNWRILHGDILHLWSDDGLLDQVWLDGSLGLRRKKKKGGEEGKEKGKEERDESGEYAIACDLIRVSLCVLCRFITLSVG